MKLIASLVTLGFATLSSGKQAKGKLGAKKLKAFSIKPVFDYSPFADAEQECDLRLGAEVSIV